MNQKVNTPLDFIDQDIPQEVLDQIEVLGRVTFRPRPTVVSAVSTAGDQPGTEADDAAEISGLVSHVADMESLADQIEDMIDELTKDMSIPADNPSVLNAVQALGGTDSITQDIFNKAQALVDFAPILMTGRDFFLDALTGNGKLEGDYMDCDQITKSVANLWNTAEPHKYSPEEPIKDETAKIADEYEQTLGEMIIELLQMFFFNMIWPRYLVDLSIINPLRSMIVTPIDRIITFFKDFEEDCGEEGKRFKIKPEECMKEHGPLSKRLKKFRCYLLCIPPRKWWSKKKYKPMVPEFDCNCEGMRKCPPRPIPIDPGIDKNSEKFEKLGQLADSLAPDEDDPCFDESDLEGDINNATGLGVPPECLKHARVILEAVQADALTPPDPTQAGIGGAVSVSTLVKQQAQGL